MHCWKEFIYIHLLIYMQRTSFSSHLHRVRVNFFNKMFPMKNSYSSGFLTNSFMMKFHKILKMFLLTIFLLHHHPRICVYVYVRWMVVENLCLQKVSFFEYTFPTSLKLSPPLASLFFYLSFIIIMDAPGRMNN